MLKRAILSEHNRHNFNALNYGVPLGKTEEVSLLCSKVHELKPFRLDSYIGKRDINACLNSMFFCYTIAEICRRKYKENLMIKFASQISLPFAVLNMKRKLKQFGFGVSKMPFEFGTQEFCIRQIPFFFVDQISILPEFFHNGVIGT